MNLELLRSVAAGRHGVVTLEHLSECGVSPNGRRALVQHGVLLRLSRTRWLVDPFLQEELPTLARVRAAVEDQGSDAYAILRAAAALHRLPGLPQRLDTLDVGVPSPRHQPHEALPIGRVRVHVPVVAEREIVTVDGVRCTCPHRTLLDLILTSDRETAVSALDGALHTGIVDHDTLTRLLASAAGRRGLRQAERFVALADGRAESALETRIRLCAGDVGLPPEHLQWTLVDAHGHLIAVADLAWPSRKLLAEADGAAFHSGGPRRRYDRRRQNAIEILPGSWRLLRFDWEDALTRGYVGSTVRSAWESEPA